MFNRRVVLFCILLAVLTVILQAVPEALGGVFVFAVALSGISVYIAARLNYILGIIIFAAISVLLTFINISEALFFICISGIPGLSMGIMKNRFNNLYAIPIPAALTAFTMLSLVNHLFGLRIFSNSYHNTIILQALSLVPPLYIYCLIYLRLSILAENWIRSSIDLRSY